LSSIASRSGSRGGASEGFGTSPGPE
jgi:hypothetical protein